MSLFPSEAQGPWRLTIPLEGVPSSPMLRLEISRPRRAGAMEQPCKQGTALRR